MSDYTCEHGGYAMGRNCEKCREEKALTEAKIRAQKAKIEALPGRVEDFCKSIGAASLADAKAIFDDLRKENEELRGKLTSLEEINSSQSVRLLGAEDLLGRSLAIIDSLVGIGKRDLTNPKYDCYFTELRAVRAALGKVP